MISVNYGNTTDGWMRLFSTLNQGEILGKLLLLETTGYEQESYSIVDPAAGRKDNWTATVKELNY